jgi:Trk K+ transport system NAD-binding subunit
MKYTWKERFRYYFENTFTSGPLGIIRWLAMMSLFTILVLGLVIVIFGIRADPEAQSGLSFIEGAWQSLMATLDSGTMGGDEGWAFRSVRFVATLVGIFLISILIGIISAAIDAKIENLRKGKSRVLESNHTLILGWSSKIYSIIQEIILANENLKKPVIVVFAEQDKVAMEDALRENITDLKNTKLVVRSGNPMISTEVQIVNPNAARNIIVLSPEEEEADIQVIKTVMSLTNSSFRKKEPFHIVAEIQEESNIEAAELVGQGEATFVFASDLIARITAQTCRQSGLAVIYTDLLRFEGDEIYFQEEPQLVGKTYQDAVLSYNSSALIGLNTKRKGLLLNPNRDEPIMAGDQVVAISRDDDTVILDGNGKKGLQDPSAFKQKQTEMKGAERLLFLGWNETGFRIVAELNSYVAKGSELVILNESPIDLDPMGYPNFVVAQVQGEITNRSNLENIHPETFDHIILMSNRSGNIQSSDARTLVCLLHLRNIGERFNKDMSIVSEMRDLRNREIGIVAKADDFIVGENISSLILSQISENKALKSVFDVLFDSDGSEIYLKPISQYWSEGEEVNFYDLAARALQYNETAIGYRIMGKKDSVDENFGVKLNPMKDQKIALSKDDFLVVLAED